ncbi:hypothetical protein GGS26DRAFT_586630 [Hypomontagnella submonticulosa]|nr:hypothetical protein GGS26DRAFT_586630 [Hypomontagnella submonticulosa]
MAFAGMAAALTPKSAYINVEAPRGNGRGNVTVDVPIETIYTNPTVLDEVSTLYLVGSSEGVPVNTITCYPYKETTGFGAGGLPFNSTTPSRLSTNTVVVGSIVCHSTVE